MGVRRPILYAVPCYRSESRDRRSGRLSKPGAFRWGYTGYARSNDGGRRGGGWNRSHEDNNKDTVDTVRPPRRTRAPSPSTQSTTKPSRNVSV